MVVLRTKRIFTFLLALVMLLSLTPLSAYALEDPAAAEAPAVTEAPEVTETPEASETPEPSETPEATGTPEATETLVSEERTGVVVVSLLFKEGFVFAGNGKDKCKKNEDIFFHNYHLFNYLEKVRLTPKVTVL